MSVVDSLYGHFVLPPALQQAIAHPIFQRLSHIAQLGLSMLSPGSAMLRHTRAEHCKGVAYLTGVVAVALKLNPEETLLAQMAGLLHDVGHGPFSHVFENVSPIRHEERSQELAQVILSDIWSPEWIATVCYLIDPNGLPPNDQAQKLQDLVANKRCHVDIDKLDYLLRDSYYAGIPFVPVARVVEFFYHSRLTDGRWEFHESQRGFLRLLFEHRTLMFERIYHHPVNKILEEQLTKAAKQLTINFQDQTTFLAHTDATFLAVIAETSAGQTLLRGYCDNLTIQPSIPDPQAFATVLPSIPFYI